MVRDSPEVILSNIRAAKCNACKLASNLPGIYRVPIGED
jgi:hypothetical protein